MPGIAIGAFAVSAGRAPLLGAAFMGLAAIIQPIIDVRILRWLNFDEKLERVRDPVILSVVAGPAGALVAAVVSMTDPDPERTVDRSASLAICCTLWWLRDWLGVMVTAPLMFAWV